MGLRIVMLAARGRERGDVLVDLGIEATGEHCLFFESDISGVQLGEWYLVVVADRGAFRERIDDPLLAKLAASGELAVCGVHEGNMVSFATRLIDGQETWSVVRDGNLGHHHLAVVGDVPSLLADLLPSKRKAHDAGSGVDHIFGVPSELFADLTGFHLDWSGDELRYDVLIPKGPARPPPEGASRYMEIDSRPAVHWPLACQIMATIDAMTPHGGPGFIILQGPDQDYMQTAGGDGVYLAEWREHESGAFRHFVAGRRERVPPGTVQVPTNAEHGNYVLAHRNETLSAEEVKCLARAFLAGEPRPETFAWRDITAMFG